MRKSVLVVLASFVLAALTAHAQTTTSYNIPAGQACTSSGPEACTYYPDGIPRDGFGRFQTGSNFTQLIFNANNGEYCDDSFNNPTQVWDVSDTDIPAPPLPVPPLHVTYTNQSGVKLYEMHCLTTSLVNNYMFSEGHTVHAEIFAYSFTRNYPCGGRVRTICHQTNWTTVDGSFVEVIEP